MAAFRVATVLLLFAVLLLSSVNPTSAQQDWPSRTIKLIVPFAAGGNTDILGRLIADRIEKKFGAPMVVENRPGAGAKIGAEAAAKSPGDGYTFFIGTASTHGINSTLYKKLRYDPIADFEPVLLVAKSPLYLFVSAKLPASSVTELLEYATRTKAKLSYGSVGVGTPHHLAGELFKRRTGLDMVHVPYRGSAPAITDLMTGSIQLMFDATAIAQAQEGALRVLAVASRERWAATPEVPSMAEQGVPNFEVGGWFALLAPARTPETVISRVNQEINLMLKDEVVVARLKSVGLLPAGGSAAEMKALVISEIDRWREMVRLSGVFLE